MGYSSDKENEGMKMALTERERIIKEVQAFASEYGHLMTRDGVTRDVVIVEQLLDFLTPIDENKP